MPTSIRKQRLFRAAPGLLRDARGLGAIEYALLFVLIVIGLLAVWQKLGRSLASNLQEGEGRFSATLGAAQQGLSGGSASGIDPGSSVGAGSSRGASPGAAPGSRPAAHSGGPISQAPGASSGPGAPAPGASSGVASSRPGTPAPGASHGATGPRPGAPAPSKAASSHSSAAKPASAALPAKPEPGLWERTREYVRNSSPVQMGLGIAYGTVQALAPGGFLAPSPWGSSKPFEVGRAGGQIVTGVVQTATGVGLMGGGGATTVAGGVGAPVTGGGSLVVSAGGLVVAAEGLAVAAQGVSNVAAGGVTLANAMSMSDDPPPGGGGSGMPPSGSSPPPAGQPPAGKLDVGQVVQNPKSVWGKSADEIADSFNAAGYKATVRQSTKGSQQAQIIEIKGHKEITQIQVHPGGGRHGGAYVKISTSTQGKIKVVDPATYKPTPGESVDIHKIGEP
jgi:Flp pilus assembly pilin Flp